VPTRLALRRVNAKWVLPRKLQFAPQGLERKSHEPDSPQSRRVSHDDRAGRDVRQPACYASMPALLAALKSIAK
jgi:hypothetical protein